MNSFAIKDFLDKHVTITFISGSVHTGFVRHAGRALGYVIHPGHGNVQWNICPNQIADVTVTA